MHDAPEGLARGAERLQDGRLSDACAADHQPESLLDFDPHRFTLLRVEVQALFQAKVRDPGSQRSVVDLARDEVAHCRDIEHVADTRSDEALHGAGAGWLESAGQGNAAPASTARAIASSATAGELPRSLPTDAPKRTRIDPGVALAVAIVERGLNRRTNRTDARRSIPSRRAAASTAPHSASAISR